MTIAAAHFVAKRSSAAARRRLSPVPVVRAKLSCPDVDHQVLDRPRLLQALAAHATRPVTLLIADAGYGKTTLLGAFARSLRRPVIWYSLAPSDADAIVFGRHVLEGFRRDAPRFGRDFERALDDARPGSRSIEMLAGTLANELAMLKGPTRLLVLDNFQDVAASRTVIGFTDTLLRYLPPSVRLVISARTAPPLALERARSSGDVFELHSGHLRYTTDELAQLFADVYRRPLEATGIEALEQATLGWPTAVHLVHEALRRDSALGLEGVLADFRSSNLELHDYLSAEVYSRLDGDARLLLDRTVAVQRFDPPLAAALTGLPHPAATLEGLVRRGLLRAFGSGAQVSYECNDLVRRFVRHELETIGGPAALREAEAAVAATLAARGEPERALRHWLRAGRAGEAAASLRELAPALLADGRAATVLEYLSELPAATVRDDVDLALTLADTRQTLGNWDEAEVLYVEVLERCRSRALRAAECRALIGLGKVLNLRGRHEQVLGMAERGLGMGMDVGPGTRARLYQMKAGAHFYLGQYQAAIEVLARVRALLADTPDPELLLPTIHNLAGAYAAQGRFREASSEFRVALAQVRGTSSPRAPLYLSNLSFHLSELGEIPEARRAAEEGLLAAQRFSNRAQECICHQALAQALAQSGDLDGALAAVKRAEELNAELRMEVIEADLLLLHGRVFLARGQYRRAVEFVNEAIGRLEQRPDDPRLAEARAALAWCELRAGRLSVARALLAPLATAADAGENGYLQMRIHYWLGEALLALGEHAGVGEHLTIALARVRERGYRYFLEVQAREDAAPLLYALAHGIEPDTVAAALVEAGPAVEAQLLQLLNDPAVGTGETVLAVLAEVGGPVSIVALSAIGRDRPALLPAVKSALRHIEGRSGRGAAALAPAAPAVRLVLHGPPHLILDGRPLPASSWRTQRAFQMLVYLALHPGGVSRDVLLDRFWPGRQAAAGRRNLHPTLSYIRGVLPRADAAPILREGERYRLNPAYPLTCDAWDLDQAADAARRAEDARERRTELERAIELASGRFLDGFYADWADELTSRSRDRMEKILLQLANLCATMGDFEPALGLFQRALELDEFREATCLAVMECHVRLGNRRAAMVDYERLRTLLRRELGVDPLPETEDAVKRLLSGDSVHGWRDPGPPTRSKPSPEPSGAQHVRPLAQVPLKDPV